MNSLPSQILNVVCQLDVTVDKAKIDDFMKPRLLILLSWIGAVIFFLGGLGALLSNGAFLAFLAYTIAGLLLLPTSQAKIASISPNLLNKKVKTVLIILCLVIAGMSLSTSKSSEKIVNENTTPDYTEANKNIENQGVQPVTTQPESAIEMPKDFELIEVVNYEGQPYSKQGYEDIRSHTFGLYMKINTDTTGAEEAIVDYLNSKNIVNRDNAQVWVFTDKKVIPRSFQGEWSTKRSRQKCFAHAAKLPNGNILYDYDIFGEYKQQ